MLDELGVQSVYMSVRYPGAGLSKAFGFEIAKMACNSIEMDITLAYYGAQGLYGEQCTLPLYSLLYKEKIANFSRLLS